MNEKRLSSSVVGFILAVLAIPLLYFVTSGPALALAYSGRLGYSGTAVERLRAIYQPAVWVADDTFLEAPFKAYVAWWDRVFETP